MLAVTSFGAAGLLAAYLLIRKLDTSPLAAICCLLIACSRTTFEMFTIMVGSDTAYFAVTMLLLWAARLVDAAPHARRAGLWRAAAALMLPLSILIRPIGVSLIISLILWLAASWFADPNKFRVRLHHMWPALAAGILAQAMWALYARLHTDLDWPGQYMQSHIKTLLLKDYFYPELGTVTVPDLVARVLQNIVYLNSTISSYCLSHWIQPFPSSIFAVAPAILGAAGLFESVRRGGGYWSEWYVIIYYATLSIWIYPAGFDRYLFPVMPLVALYILRGAVTLWALLLRAPACAAPIAAVLPLALGAWTIVSAARGLTFGLQTKATAAMWLVIALAAVAGCFTFVRKSAARALSIEVRPANNLTLNLGIASYVGFATLAAVLGYGLLGQWRIARHNWHPNPQASRVVEVRAARWLLENSATSAVVMAEQESITHRFSRRRVVVFPPSSDTRMIMDVIERRNVSLLLVVDAGSDFVFWPRQQERMASLLELYPARFKLLKQDPTYRIFEVLYPSS
jgi:hypothetical protein